MVMRFKGYLVLAGVFVFGAVAGGGGMFAYAQHEYAALLQKDDPVENRRVSALSLRLGLEAPQQDQVRAIMANAREDMRSLSREAVRNCGDPVRTRRERMHEEIRAILSPEQRAKFDSIFGERR